MSDSVRPHRRQPTRLPPSLGFSRQEHWSGLPFPSSMHESEKWKWSRSVQSDSWRPHGLQPTRLLRPWDFPGKSTGVGCHCLLEVGECNTTQRGLGLLQLNSQSGNSYHLTGLSRAYLQYRDLIHWKIFSFIYFLKIKIQESSARFSHP